MEVFLQTVGSINDETRLKILKFIETHGELCVCDIEKSFDMLQSRISRHLKILKDGGFLRLRREGKWAHYSIRAPLDIFRQSVLSELSHIEIPIPDLQKGCKI